MNSSIFWRFVLQLESCILTSLTVVFPPTDIEEYSQEQLCEVQTHQRTLITLHETIFMYKILKETHIRSWGWLCSSTFYKNGSWQRHTVVFELSLTRFISTAVCYCDLHTNSKMYYLTVFTWNNIKCHKTCCFSLFFQDLITFMDKMVSNNNTSHTLLPQRHTDSSSLCPFSSPYHRSPWWVTTGAAFWRGPWLSITLRESGEHTHRFGDSADALCCSKMCLFLCVKGCSVSEHSSVPRGSFCSSCRETEGCSHIWLPALLPKTCKSVRSTLTR